MSYSGGESDCSVRANKAAGATPAEAVEQRRQAEGNAIAARLSRRSMRVYNMGTALDGIRQTAKGRRDAKFAALLHHIYAVERLEGAYRQGNLCELSHRHARGGYRPQLVKRAYIDKADGSKRLLGVLALEDKIVQRAAA